MIPRLVIGTKNPDKVAEIEAIITPYGLAGEIVRGLDWPEVAEVGETLEENALLKARAVSEATGLPALADDTGLEVAALGGGPGVRSARFAGPAAVYADNRARLLSVMDGVDDRRARFRSVVALALPDGDHVLAEGSLDGVIIREPRGSGGFGYDPIFEVEGRTLAEMTLEEKNQISHRARALRTLMGTLGLRPEA